MLFVLYSNKFYTVSNYTCTRSAARDWNNAFSLPLVKVGTGFSLNHSRNHTFMTSTQKGGFVTRVLCFQILLFVNNRSIAHFFWWGVGGGWQNWSFLVDVINVWPLIINNKWLNSSKKWKRRRCFFRSSNN